MNAATRWIAGWVLLLLTYAAAASNPKLAWDANSEPALAGYKLYFGTTTRGCVSDPLDERFVYGGGAAQGGSPIVIFLNELTDPANPSYVLAGLPPGVNKFAVTAFDTNIYFAGGQYVANVYVAVNRFHDTGVIVNKQITCHLRLNVDGVHCRYGAAVDN